MEQQRHNAGSRPLDANNALQAELAASAKAEAESSLLRRAIDIVTEPYHHQAAAKRRLEEAADQVAKSGSGQSSQNLELAKAVLAENATARQNEADAYKITSNAAKTLGSFSRGRFGLMVAGTIYALDEAKPNENFLSDAALGFAKGLAMREVVKHVAGAGASENVAIMSLKLGATSRVVDTSLTRNTYLNDAGEFTASSFASGLAKSATEAVDPIALGSDLATAGLAHGMFKLAPQQLAGNTFRAMSTMTFTRGFASGLSDEAQSQYASGKLDFGRLASFPLAMALSTSLAAAPGNQRLQVHKYSLENAASIREREYKLISIAPSEVKAIASRGSKAAESIVKTVGEGLALGQPEKLLINRANVPTDWISAATNALKFRGADRSGRDEIRLVSRQSGNVDAPWQLTIDKGASTISQMIKRHSNYHQGSTIAPFVKDLKEPVLSFLGSGSESGAFKLSNGAVLKLASSLYAERTSDWGKLPHDAKAMYGPTMLNVADPHAFRMQPAHSLLLQEPLRTPVSEAQAAALRTQMEKDKVRFHDYNFKVAGEQVSWAVDQVGINANGKPVMLDYGARRAFYEAKTESK